VGSAGEGNYCSLADIAKNVASCEAVQFSLFVTVTSSEVITCKL